MRLLARPSVGTLRAKLPTVAVAPTLGLLVAAALALALVCHTWHLTVGGAPRKWVWLASVIGLTLVFSLLTKPWARWADSRFSTDWRALMWFLLAAGCLLNATAVFRFGQLGDNLWVLPRSVQTLAGVLLWCGDALLIAAFLGSALALLPRTNPTPAANPEPSNVGVRWGIVAALLFINAVAFVFVSAERTAYFWDFSTYWLMSGSYAETWDFTAVAAFDRMIDSLRIDEYTGLPAFLPGLLLSGTGDTRLAYILIIANLYGVAVFAALHFAVGRRSAWPVLLAATSPLLWMPTLRGYLDFGGVAFALVALGVYLRRKPGELRWQDVVIVGTSLAAMALFRRWYSFWVVSFFLVAGIEAFALLVRRKSFAPTRSLVVVGGVAAFAMVSFALPMVLSVIGANYAGAYTAYRVPGSGLERLHVLLRDIGYGYVIAFAAASVAVIANAPTRRMGLFAVALVPLIHWQFHNVQDMGFHHRLLYAPSFLLVVGTAGAMVRGRLAFAAMLTVSAFGMALGLCPSLAEWRAKLEPVAPCAPIYPLVRDDVEVLYSIAADAQAEAERIDDRFCVVASSLTLNPTAVTTVHRSLGRQRPADWRQNVVTEVDKVSGFPDRLMTSDVVVVADPPQLHLRPEEQQIVALTAREFLDGVGIGAAFRRLPKSYPLADGVTAHLFVRERLLTTAEVNAYRERLRQTHPDRPDVFTPRFAIPVHDSRP